MESKLIDLKSYTQMTDFGDFDFLIDSKGIRKCDFLNSDLLIDLKSYILGNLNFKFLIDSISL